MRTGVIIPCFNEENRINSEAFIQFIKENDNYHLCFVNDGSSDNTLNVLNKIKTERTTKVSVIDIKKNRGKAYAVRAGVRYLFNRQDVEYIGFIDADLSTDFNDFKKLVRIIDGDKKLSLVYGSRGKGDGNIEKNLMRSFFSKIIKMVVFLILGLSIQDTQCGAKVFRRSIIPVAFNQKFLTKWLFDVEVFMKLKKYFGANEVMNRIHEQPLDRWEHVDDSKLGLKDSFEIPVKLLQIWFSYSFNYKLDTNFYNKKYKSQMLQLKNTRMAA